MRYLKLFLHILAGLAIWLGCQILSTVSFLFPQGIISTLVSVTIQIVFTYLLLSFYCKNILHIHIAECRIKLVVPRPLWLFCAILLPVLVSACIFLLIPGTFSYNRLTSPQLAEQIIVAVFATCITASITEEMIFRGFIMKLIENRCNKICAIIIPSIIFAAFHLIGVDINLLGIVQLIIAGTSVGIMFSLICYQSGSICSSAVVHGIWNLIMIGGILDIGTDPSSNAIFTYHLATHSQLMTGGPFGIESSLPAIAGYWCVIIITLLLLRSKQSPAA
ncbi:CPBP family intramembrane glutamic endopeptidase [Hungatella effluvii]|uniref:CPBP family intramembrane glutamic endopeptidase n=2 Tax=Hungatella effluvii TaxID=1096246 RepID=UPI002A8344C8|nr:type II CAAX endopeptidase family protein [Hungatella effluvii]